MSASSKKAFSENFATNSSVFAPQSRKLADFLLAQIKLGEFRPGDKLPSVRKLAEQFNVSRQVVLSAFNRLSHRGLVHSEHGNGTFVSNRINTSKCKRITLFINRQDIVPRALDIHCAYVTACKRDYELKLIYNEAQDWGIGEYLAQSPAIDGIAVFGIVDEVMLKPLAASSMPYIVLGDYNISSAHPQSNSKIHRQSLRALTKAFHDSGAKKIAVFTSVLHYRSHRNAMDMVLKAFANCGIPPDPSIIFNTEGNGYKEIKYLLEEAHPEAIYFQIDHWQSYVRYLKDHPDVPHPCIIVNDTETIRMPYKFYDFVVKHKNTRAFIETGINRLIDFIEYST